MVPCVLLFAELPGSRAETLWLLYLLPLLVATTAVMAVLWSLERQQAGKILREFPATAR